MKQALSRDAKRSGDPRRTAGEYTHPTLRHLRAGGYTLIEMMVTVALLIIVLGLMVSMARYVRERAAVALTRDLLRQLDEMTTRYAARFDGRTPIVTAFPPAALPRPATAPSAADTFAGQPDAGGYESTPASRRAVWEAAVENNKHFVAALKAEPDLSAALNTLPLSMYDEVVLRDAWGSPIVFMPSMHPLVGTAPNDRFFFFSAGPDRLYLLKQDDNLYSYEDLTIERPQ